MRYVVSTSRMRYAMFNFAATLALFAGLGEARAQQSAPTFDSPEAAEQALLDAAKSGEKGAMVKVFGEGVKELVSGDPTQDRQDASEFAKRLEEAHRWVADDDGSMILHVGLDDYPFPVPLVKRDSKWAFDIAAGKEEIINRRVGRNELRTLAVCRAYVVAQREYASEDRDGDQVLEFAQRCASTPGQHDGLFWESAPGEPLSPLGPLVAEARAQGYGADKATRDESAPHPYHGYVYRILTKQGKDAPGGAFDYVINGNMVAGFAAVVYPVAYGDSGVMTFLVGPNGEVYEKDLGPDTGKLAAAMTEFNPDSSWTVETDDDDSDDLSS